MKKLRRKIFRLAIRHQDVVSTAVGTLVIAFGFLWIPAIWIATELRAFKSSEHGVMPFMGMVAYAITGLVLIALVNLLRIPTEIKDRILLEDSMPSQVVASDNPYASPSEF